MDARDVVDVLAVLGEADVTAWLDGGWGIEALLGEQNRDHDDLDLVVNLAELDAAVAALAEVGFTIDTDQRPTRLTIVDRHGRRVDFHPVRFDEHGDGHQAGAGADGGDAVYPADAFSYGWVAGRKVACIGPELQVSHHDGYPPTDKDRHDLALLVERFGVSLPDGYR